LYVKDSDPDDGAVVQTRPLHVDGLRWAVVGWQTAAYVKKNGRAYPGGKYYLPESQLRPMAELPPLDVKYYERQAVRASYLVKELLDEMLVPLRAAKKAIDDNIIPKFSPIELQQIKDKAAADVQRDRDHRLTHPEPETGEKDVKTQFHVEF
jgi:hypothetical protein